MAKELYNDLFIYLFIYFVLPESLHCPLPSDFPDTVAFNYIVNVIICGPYEFHEISGLKITELHGQHGSLDCLCKYTDSGKLANIYFVETPLNHE